MQMGFQKSRFRDFHPPLSKYDVQMVLCHNVSVSNCFQKRKNCLKMHSSSKFIPGLKASSKVYCACRWCCVQWMVSFMTWGCEHDMSVSQQEVQIHCFYLVSFCMENFIFFDNIGDFLLYWFGKMKMTSLLVHHHQHFTVFAGERWHFKNNNPSCRKVMFALNSNLAIRVERILLN